MVPRARLVVRVTGLLAGLSLATLGFTLPSPAASAAASVPSTPLSASVSAATGPAGVQAKAAAVENAVTGQLLWSRAENTERPMASITKVMTALLVIKAGGLNRTITVPASVISYVRKYDASNAGLRPGDKLTARQLLYALLLPSGADAAYTLAQAYGPGTGAFIKKMNATAELMGMSRTHFSNFDGLPWPTEYANYSTAANLLILGRTAMRYAAFRSIVDQRSYRIAAGSGHHAYLWRNINPLIAHYPGAIGIKPGYTAAAGQCLLFEATRDGHSVIGVTLGSPGSITVVSTAAATRVLSWAFGLRGY
jgi:D-alanyl-D-alanine carboxypeptidase (penicillin-binding protein 5/6)